MTCPHGDAGDTNRRRRRTSLGYRTFTCRACRRVFNERSGTAFNDRQYPPDVVRLAVLRRLRDTRSCRDIAAMRLERGCSVTPEAIREWACRFAPRVTARLRATRRGRAGRAWSLDETDVQVGPGAGALSTAPSTGRAPSWTPGSARTATRTPHGASCGDSWMWPSARRSASRPMPIRPTAERSAGSSGRRSGTDAARTGTPAPSTATGRCRSAPTPCWASEDSRPPRAFARRSMRAGTPSALASDEATLSPWPSSASSSSHAGGH